MDLTKISYIPTKDVGQIFLYHSTGSEFTGDYLIVSNVPAPVEVDGYRLSKKDKDLKGVWKIKTLKCVAHKK